MTLSEIKALHTKQAVANYFAFNMDRASQLSSLNILKDLEFSTTAQADLLNLKNKIEDNDITAEQVRTELERLFSIEERFYLNITAIPYKGGLYSILAMLHDSGVHHDHDHDHDGICHNDKYQFYKEITRINPNSLISLPNGQVYYVNENSVLLPANHTVPSLRFKMYFESLSTTIDGKKVITQSMLDTMLRSKAGADLKFNESEFSSALEALGIPKELHDSIFRKLTKQYASSEISVAQLKELINKFNDSNPSLTYEEYEEAIIYILNLSIPEKHRHSAVCSGRIEILKDTLSLNKLDHYYYVP